MKKGIIVLLVAVLAISTVFAGDFKFTGKAQVGYTVSLDDGSVTPYGRDKLNASRINLAVSGDWYSISLRGAMYSRTSSSEGMAATINVDMVKLLATEDIDLPVSLKLAIGNQSITSGSVYADPEGNGDDYIAFATTRTNLPMGITVGYSDYTVMGGLDFKGNWGVQATGAVADKAVKAQAAIAGTADSKLSADASAYVNIAKLADMDIALDVSGYGKFDFEDSSKNMYIGAVTTSIEGIGVSAEFASKAGVNSIYAGVDYKFADVKFTPYVYASTRQYLDDADKSYYTVGGEIYCGGASVGAYTSITKAAKSISTYIAWNF